MVLALANLWQEVGTRCRTINAVSLACRICHQRLLLIGKRKGANQVLLQVWQVVNDQFQCSGGRALQLVRRHCRYCRTLAGLVADPKERIIAVIRATRAQTALIFQIAPATVGILGAQALTATLVDRAIVNFDLVHAALSHGVQVHLIFVEKHVRIHRRVLLHRNVGVLNGSGGRLNDNLLEVARLCASKHHRKATGCS